jgi:hypothetical protein
MLCLKGGDVRNSGKDMSHMSRSPFNTVSVVDLAFSGLLVNVEQVQIVIEINVTSTQISVCNNICLLRTVTDVKEKKEILNLPRRVA